MNPIIANANAKARHDEFLREADQYRLQKRVSRRVPGFISAIISLFI
jgi:hypothetical protein